jgi:hypothetical protein
MTETTIKQREPLGGIELLIERGVARTRQQAYRLVRLGLVPRSVALTVGRSVRVNPEGLENWIAGGGNSPPTEAVGA